jgi:hypothetical protein
MKYIIFEKASGGVPLPVLFPAPATHADVALLFAPGGYRPVHAGYVEAEIGAVMHRSESLGLEPGERDARTIDVMARVTLGMLTPEERRPAAPVASGR